MGRGGEGSRGWGGEGESMMGRGTRHTCVGGLVGCGVEDTVT